MLYATESLKILLQVVEPQEKHTSGAQCLKNFKCMYKSLGNYGRLPRTQQKDHKTSRAASAMIQKDKEADILVSSSRLGAVFFQHFESWHTIYSCFEIGQKPAVVNCLTNAQAPSPIALESCSRAQTDRPVV